MRRGIKKDPISSCQQCQKQIKPNSETSKRCKCPFVVFCNSDCKKKSKHFKECTGGGVASVRDLDNTAKMMNEMDLNRIDKRLTDEVDEGLKTVYNKSFEELMEMEDNSTACWRIAVTLMNATREDQKTPIFPVLPKEYSEKSIWERYELANKWLQKAHDKGHPMATISLGKNMVNPQFAERLNLDGREGMIYLAISKKRGDPNSEDRFKECSMLIHGIQAMMGLLKTDDGAGNIISQTRAYIGPDLGALVLARCLDHLLDILTDKPGVGLTKEEWGFKELYQFREMERKIVIHPNPSVPPDIRSKEFKCCVIPGHGVGEEEECYVKNDYSTKYVTAPNYEFFIPLEDLERVARGPDEVDKANHARYACQHVADKYRPPREVCRLCYKQGMERVRAVASAAYCMSKTFTEKSGTNLESKSVFYKYGVIYEVEHRGERRRIQENFMGYCKEEIDSVIKILSLHSADVDPRMICINPDFYWSVIWFYGSVSKALKEIGGQKLYNIGFGTHQLYNEPPGLYATEGVMTLDNMFKMDPPGPCPGKSNFQLLDSEKQLLSDNFVSRLENKKTTWRYGCSNPDCNNLEDNTKFNSCGGCVKIIPRKYCGQDCQAKDWTEHKKHCKQMEEKVKPPAWMTRQNKKGKTRK